MIEDASNIYNLYTRKLLIYQPQQLLQLNIFNNVLSNYLLKFSLSLRVRETLFKR
jgi:hypothetical protein